MTGDSGREAALRVLVDDMAGFGFGSIDLREITERMFDAADAASAPTPRGVSPFSVGGYPARESAAGEPLTPRDAQIERFQRTAVMAQSRLSDALNVLRFASAALACDGWPERREAVERINDFLVDSVARGGAERHEMSEDEAMDREAESFEPLAGQD